MDTARTWAEIDLDALAHNLAAIRLRAGPGPRIVLVAKADAYGHGAVAVSHHAVRCGVAALGVGTSAEALELRRAGVRARIWVLGTIVDEEVRPCLLHDIEIGLHSHDRCRSLAAAARRLGRRARVHVNVDTGMGRLGVLPEEALPLLRAVRRAGALELAGVMTHLAGPDDARQLARFDAVLGGARAEGLLGADTWVHAANSAHLFRAEGARYDAVRPGLAAYGVVPDGGAAADELLPVLSWRTKVVFLKDLPAGAAVGYDATWVAARRTRIATLPVGYHDGLPWSLSDRGVVLVGGRRAPIVGRVSMDYTTVDVTDVPGVRVGDVVTLIGADGDERLGVEELARRAGTIPHEVTCSVGERVGRVFRGGERIEPVELPRTPARARPAGTPA